MSPGLRPGIQKVFDSVIAIMILRKYSKGMAGLVYNYIPTLKELRTTFLRYKLNLVPIGVHAS